MKMIFKSLAVFLPTKHAFYAFIAGMAAVLAYAPVSVSAIMLVSLAILFWLWHKSESRINSMRIGLWFGLGLFGVGVSWLFSSLYVYSGISLALSALATFIFVLLLSMYFMLAGLVVHYFYDPEKKFLGFVFLMPVAIVFFEMLRATLFTGFPFLLIGNTHLFSWLDGLVPVFGIAAVSLTVSITAGLLLFMFVIRNWIIPSLFIFLLWLVSLSVKNIEFVEKDGLPVDIALIQANVSQDKKWSPEQFKKTLHTYVSLSRENLDADVIVWSEVSIPAYFDQVKNRDLKTFIADAQLLEKDILMGVIIRHKATAGLENDRFYNAIVNARDTELVYKKSHLVPFSEFFPFPDLFRFLSSLFDIPFSEFNAGETNPLPMQIGKHKVGLSICYEMSFGSGLTRHIDTTSYLINVSNDGWFANTLQPFQQRQEVQIRALELGREIARSANRGHTFVVGVDGQIRDEIPAYETGVLRTQIQPYKGETPFSKWSNYPVWLFLILSLVFLGWQKYKLKKR